MQGSAAASTLAAHNLLPFDSGVQRRSRRRGWPAPPPPPRGPPRWVRPRVARARDEVGNAERGGDAMMNVHVSPPPAHDDDGALAAGVGGTGA